MFVGARSFPQALACDVAWLYSFFFFPAKASSTEIADVALFPHALASDPAWAYLPVIMRRLIG